MRGVGITVYRVRCRSFTARWRSSRARETSVLRASVESVPLVLVRNGTFGGQTPLHSFASSLFPKAKPGVGTGEGKKFQQVLLRQRRATRGGPVFRPGDMEEDGAAGAGHDRVVIVA